MNVGYIFPAGWSVHQPIFVDCEIELTTSRPHAGSFLVGWQLIRLV
jgi:hypothetical protein